MPSAIYRCTHGGCKMHGIPVKREEKHVGGMLQLQYCSLCLYVLMFVRKAKGG